MFRTLEVSFDRLPDGRFHVCLSAKLWNVLQDYNALVDATADFMVQGEETSNG
jgi:hypothetical protein